MKFHISFPLEVDQTKTLRSKRRRKDASARTATCADLSTSCEAPSICRSTASRPTPQPSSALMTISSNADTQQPANSSGDAAWWRGKMYQNVIFMSTLYKLFTHLIFIDLCIQFVPTGKPSAAELPVNREAVECPGRKMSKV